MTFNGMSTRLEHFHYDVFASPKDPLNPLENLKVLFLYDRTGEIDRLLVPMEPAVSDIEFQRVGDNTMLSRERIAQLVGVYRSQGELIHVEERPGPAIWLRVGGQPSYELVPFRDRTYRLNTLEGYSVEFIEESGLVVGLTLRQPNGIVTADRQ